MYIYKVLNILNKEAYIGQTTRSVSVRWNEHKRDAYVHNKQGLLHRAMRKYGIENFTIEAVFKAENLEELNKKEVEFINQNNSVINGYNIESGGRNEIRSEQTRLKMSKMRTGKKNPSVIESNIKRRGKTKSNLGYLGNSNRVGKKMSIEAKLKISQSLIGNSRRAKKQSDTEEE